MFCITQSNITIYEVEELKTSFEELLTSNDIKIDFVNVEKIDFAGISLLLSLVKTCETNLKNLKFINLNESILNNIVLCGTDKILRKYYE